MMGSRNLPGERPLKDALRAWRWSPLLWFALLLLVSGYMLFSRI
jgi:hypothetical protein